MGRLLDGIISWSINNRAVVLLIAAMAVAAGIWSSANAKLDALPDFMPPRVVVQTEAPGMNTTDVEELVTRPLERSLLGTPAVETVRSTSAPGLSVVTLVFEESVDPYRARQLVTERVDLARPQLPSTVKAPRLAPLSAPIGALLKFALTSPGDTASMAKLRTFVDWQLRPRLVALPGVSQVTVHGGDVERIEVRPDPLRMRARGVSMSQLSAAVTRSQSLLGIGFLDSGEGRLDIHCDARLPVDGIDGVLGEVVVAQTAGVPTRVIDVAQVVVGKEPRVGGALYDGRQAIYVQVMKLPFADTLATTRAVEGALEQLKLELPAGAQLEPPVFRQASFVHAALFSVGRAMAIGAVLVVLVLLSFLRRGRLAAISLTAIPLSLLAAVTTLVAFGVSINGMTLGGLAIAVGEVVDDAIVDVENVWRRLRENARLSSPRPALDVIHDASREVRGSVVYASFIVALVLVPILLMGGIAGRIFSPLAQAYILAIAASLLVALTVTPALCAVLLPHIATSDARPTRFAEALLERYRRVLRAAVRHPGRVLVPALVAGVLALVVLPLMGGRFLPEFREGGLIAHVYAAPGASVETSLRLARAVDASARPEHALHIAARAGRAELDEDAAPANRIEMDFVLNPDVEAEPDKLVVDLAASIGKVPGLGFVVEGFLGERIHELLSGVTAPVVVKVKGPDLKVLRKIARLVLEQGAAIPGLGSVRMEPQVDVPQLDVRPNPMKLALHGVTPADVAESLSFWQQGRSQTQLLGSDGRVVDVVLAGGLQFQSQSTLADVPVPSLIHGEVNLSAVATIETTAVPAVLTHEGGERRIVVTADAPGAGLSGAVAELERRLKGLALPPGYRIEVGGEGVARAQAASRLALVGALVLVAIFALLAQAFGSLKDAGIVLLNFPLGLVGGVVAAGLNPEGLSVAGLVGFVTLFGIIARNGIMLVAHKRQLDSELPEMDAVERILRAAEERLLPIVMTAATAGLGLLPLAFSLEAAGAELESPMALIVCGGLLSSTVLNMIVLPTFYVWRTRRAQETAK